MEVHNKGAPVSWFSKSNYLEKLRFAIPRRIASSNSRNKSCAEISENKVHKCHPAWIAISGRKYKYIVRNCLVYILDCIVMQIRKALSCSRQVGKFDNDAFHFFLVNREIQSNFPSATTQNVKWRWSRTRLRPLWIEIFLHKNMITADT